MNISKILNTTSNTLNIINKAIPVYTSVKPLITNSKTLLKGFINSNKTNEITQSLEEKNKIQEIIHKDKIKESTSITFFQ